jgi:hypothetical protein
LARHFSVLAANDDRCRSSTEMGIPFLSFEPDFLLYGASPIAVFPFHAALVIVDSFGHEEKLPLAQGGNGYAAKLRGLPVAVFVNYVEEKDP